MTPFSPPPLLKPSLLPLPHSSPSAQPSDKSIQHWRVVSHFQYRPRGPVIDFLNNQLIDAVVEVFLLQPRSGRSKRSNGEARRNVTFFPISRADIHDVTARESLALSWGQYRDNGGRGEK